MTATMAAPAAAATGDTSAEAPLGLGAVAAPAIGHQLDVEMTVHNWVLCAAEPFAETLVRAREESREAAAKTYADLASARSCGLLAEMQVILQEPLYDVILGGGGHSGVYSALINISGEWASGFVVYGGLSTD